MNIVMLGPPGAGKGTQAKFVSKKFGIPHISTGDMLREEMTAHSELGKRVEKVIKSGKLVEDSLMIEIVKDRLSQSDVEKGFILDGYPRTLSQAESLDELLELLGKEINYAIYVEVPESIIIDRLSSRRVCPQCGRIYNIVSNPPKIEGLCDVCHVPLVVRDDDKPDTVKRRYDVYYEMTFPAVEYYRKRDVLFTIDGTLAAENVKDMLLNILGGAN